MTLRRILRLSAIMNHFVDSQKEMEKAESALELKNVVRVHYDEPSSVISGYVFSSDRAQQCKVELYLDQEREIKEAYCSCFHTGGTCHHIAAVALFAHYNISESVYNTVAQNSKLKEIAQRRSSHLLAITNFSEFPTKAADKEVLALNRQIADYEEHRTHSYNPPAVATENDLTLIVPNMGSLIFSEELLDSPDKRAYLQEKCALTGEVIAQLADWTVGRMNNPAWMLYRRFRLMDSYFGAVLYACRKNKYPASLFESLTGSHNFEKTEAVLWQKTQEASAIAGFTVLTGLSFKPTGLWLHSSGFLGASPAGLASDDCIVEIKCPYQYKDKDLESALTMDETYVCKFLKDQHKFEVNHNHKYYHQIQGQLHILHKKMCYLVIWTSHQTIVLSIEKDPTWANNINILNSFYLNKFLNYVLHRE